MFHRRKGSAPARPAPPSESAALAATQAFKKNQNPNPVLSASAAAAALRSHTPPPTNPANLQTKRMIRRGSNSSRVSDAGYAPNVAAPSMERRVSNGSMTERSFRSPSPNRPVTVQADPNAPPVPALPQAVKPSGSHRRASSLEPQARVSSPPPRRSGGRGMSVDTGERTPHPSGRAANLAALPPVDTNGRRSVNFSRPMSPPITPQQEIPPGQQSGQTGWFTAPIGSNVKMRKDINDIVPSISTPVSASAYETQQNVRNASTRPVHQNKNAGRALPPQGRVLSQAVRGMDNSKYAMRYDPNTRTMQPVYTTMDDDSEHSSLLAAKAASGVSPTVSQPSAPTSRPLINQQDGSSGRMQGPPSSGSRVRSALSKQPSIVRENREEEEKYDESSREPVNTSALPASPAQTVRSPSHSRSNSLQPSDALLISKVNSQSPSRHTRFAESPTIVSNTVRHEPPPRAVSPVKPALKQSPASSIRATSPITRTKSASREGSVSGIEEQHRFSGGKESRVSFGENEEIVPRTNGKPHEQERYAVRDPWENDDNYAISPRPDLPSFGSVRSRDRDAQGTSQVAAEELTTITSSQPPAGHSSDKAIGAILSNEPVTKLLAHDDSGFASRGSTHDPLPPQVTSIDSPGPMFDSSDSSDDDDTRTQPDPVLSPIQELETPGLEIIKPLESKAEASSVLPRTPSSVAPQEVAKESLDVPDIAVQPATPAAIEEDPLNDYAIYMPGGFGASWDEDEEKSAPAHSAKMSGPVAASETKPTSPQVMVPEPAPPPVHDTIHEESSDNDSVYSDAEEDFTELDQFASIDAVVESPLPKEKIAEVLSPASPVTTAVPATTEDTDWNQTKEYWSSLTKQQRDELERAAEAHRATTGPATETQQPRRKKKAPPPPPPTVGTTSQPVSQTKTTSSMTYPEERVEQRHRRAMSDPPVSQGDYQFRNKSMRAPSPGTNQPGLAMRHSMRSGSARGPMTMQTTRTARTIQTPPTYPENSSTTAPPPRLTANVPTSRSITHSPVRSVARPSLQRNDSSGSESSFKRSRPASIMSDGGRYTMKRSMRDGSAPKAKSPPASLRASSPPARSPVTNGASTKRFSLRSLSPVGRRPQRPVSFAEPSPINVPQNTAPSMKDRALRESKSPTRFSLRGKGKEPRSSFDSPKPARPSFRSRFSMDSDTDSPVARTKFVSRFADSDDEGDSPVASQDFTPVRGIPRKIGEEDRESTDLEDESGDDKRQAAATKSSGTAPISNGKAQGSALASGSMRGLNSSKHAPPQVTNGAPIETAAPSPQTPRKEKRPFFGSVGSWRKRSASVSSTIRRPENSATEKIEPVPPLPSMIPPPVHNKARPPKLQRKSTKDGVPKADGAATDRSRAEDWVLPPPPKMTSLMGDDFDARPNTSEGPFIASTERPDVGNRRVTVDGSTGLNLPPIRELRFDESSIAGAGSVQGGNAADGRDRNAKKKKKFGMLRRAFRLDD